MNGFGVIHYPYSGVFWTAQDTATKGKPAKIDITVEGSNFQLSIEIKVNGNRVFYDDNCSSHTPYGWNDIAVHFDRGGAYYYTSKSANFYGRESGSSKWVKLIALISTADSGKNNAGQSENHPDVTQKIDPSEPAPGRIEHEKLNDYTIPKKYVEFGFEFDVKDGTNWPYSGVFRTAADSEKTPVEKIDIATGGAIRTASITIKVNDKEVVHETNCESHAPHYFKQDDNIRVKAWKTGAYSNKAANFYARKSAQAAWTCVKSWTNGDQEFYISDTEGYVEYGF